MYASFRPLFTALCCSLLGMGALANSSSRSPAADDCSQVPGTQADLDACALQDFNRATEAHNKAYQALLQSVSDKQSRLLQQTQTAWAQYRAKACAFERSGVEGGSVAPTIGWQCQARLTRERTAELQRFLNCEEGDLSCVRLPR